jgi:uncharacterized membrane protein
MSNNDNNVTPFRRPPVREPDRRQGSFKDPDKQAMLTHGLAFTCFLVFFITDGEVMDFLAIAIGFCAFAVAVSKRDSQPGWAATHHEFAMRTLLIGGAVWMASTLVGIVPLVGGLGAWVIQVAVLVWVGLRGAFGILRAREREPMVRPRSFFL